jgi:hypothetical protein
MSEVRSRQRARQSYSLISPVRTVARGLRSFVSDVRDGWRDPAIAPASPTLRGYPISRP